MPRTMIIMRGISGSGKTYTANKIANERGFAPAEVIFSAADYFMINGIPSSDRSRDTIMASHAWMQQRLETSLQAGQSLVIVDNTNCRLWEVRQFIDLALLYDYVPQIQYPDSAWLWDKAECHRRNVHNVPRHVVDHQAARFEYLSPEKINELT